MRGAVTDVTDVTDVTRGQCAADVTNVTDVTRGQCAALRGAAGCRRGHTHLERDTGRDLDEIRERDRGPGRKNSGRVFVLHLPKPPPPFCQFAPSLSLASDEADGRIWATNLVRLQTRRNIAWRSELKLQVNVHLQYAQVGC